MQINKRNPSREFKVGVNKDIKIKDCGSIKLDTDEQITFITSSSAEYDVVKKSWGFYATPSINGRLKSFGLKTALVKNKYDLYYIMIVEEGCEENFIEYLKNESNEIVTWLDTPDKICLKNSRAEDV